MTRKNNTSVNRVVIVHDYLIQMGGAERVVLAWTSLFPESRILTSVTNYSLLLPGFNRMNIRNSFLQFLPKSPILFKIFFFIYPFAFIFRGIFSNKKTLYLISSSSFAKYISIFTRSPTILYCHNPTRFIFDPSYINSEISNSFLRSLVKSVFLPPLSLIDRLSAKRATVIIANSQNVQRRIQKDYNRSSLVLHPPVSTNNSFLSHNDSGYFLIVSRLIAYKSVDVVIKAFNDSGRELRIIGSGTDSMRLQSMASSNISFLGQLSDDDMIKEFSNCKALIFPGLEDFGITPLEAQAFGKPVIAYGKGGALETVINGVTGIYFDEQTVSSLHNALCVFDTMTWDALKIRDHALQFNSDVHNSRLLKIVEKFL